MLGLGGERSMGERVAQMLRTVAANVRGGSVARCGHFIPEERPDFLLEQLDAFFAAT